jgi:hypothetical protein
MLRVGFAKSCCSTLSADLDEALLLFCVGVVGALFGGEAPPSRSALPISGIETVVAVPHQRNTRLDGTDNMVEWWGQTRRDETCVTLIIVSTIRAWAKKRDP